VERPRGAVHLGSAPRRASRTGLLNLATPLLALASALCWGIGDFSGGIASRYGHVILTVVAAQGLGLVPTIALVALSTEAVPPSAALLWAAIAGGSGALGIGFFYFALARGTMGLVAPLTALIGAAIPAAVGLVYGGPATPTLLAGLVVALASVVIISMPDAQGIADVALERRQGRAAELAVIILAGVFFAGFFLGVDRAHQEGGDTWWPLMLVRVGGLTVALAGVVLLILRGGRGDLRVRRAALPVLALAALGDLGGNLFYVLANASGPLAVAVVLSSLYPVMTAILARLFLHERLTRLRLAGVGLAIVGIVLIALG
jgi:drug/metabolite transporter (DMT)-like permease